MKSTSFFFYCFLIFCPVSIFGQGIKIETKVDCDKPICSQINSKINRYFREISDVSIEARTSETDLIIKLMPLKVIGTNTPDSIVWTVIIAQPFSETELSALTSGSKNKMAVRQFYQEQIKLVTYWMQAFRVEALDQMCKELTEAIDAEHLEPLRRAKQALRRK